MHTFIPRAIILPELAAKLPDHVAGLHCSPFLHRNAQVVVHHPRVVTDKNAMLALAIAGRNDRLKKEAAAIRRSRKSPDYRAPARKRYGRV